MAVSPCVVTMSPRRPAAGDGGSPAAHSGQRPAMLTCGGLLVAGLIWLAGRPAAAALKQVEFDLIVALSGARQEYSKDAPCFVTSGSHHPLSGLQHVAAGDASPKSCACRCFTRGHRYFAVFVVRLGRAGCYCTNSIRKVGFAAPNKQSCSDTSVSVRLVADLRNQTLESLGCTREPPVRPAVKANMSALRRIIALRRPRIRQVVTGTAKTPPAVSGATEPAAGPGVTPRATEQVSVRRREDTGDSNQQSPTTSDTQRNTANSAEEDSSKTTRQDTSQKSTTTVGKRTSLNRAAIKKRIKIKPPNSNTTASKATAKIVKAAKVAKAAARLRETSAAKVESVRSRVERVVRASRSEARKRLKAAKGVQRATARVSRAARTIRAVARQQTRSISGSRNAAVPTASDVQSVKAAVRLRGKVKSTARQAHQQTGHAVQDVTSTVNVRSKVSGQVQKVNLKTTAAKSPRSLAADQGEVKTNVRATSKQPARPREGEELATGVQEKAPVATQRQIATQSKDETSSTSQTKTTTTTQSSTTATPTPQPNTITQPGTKATSIKQPRIKIVAPTQSRANAKPGKLLAKTTAGRREEFAATPEHAKQVAGAGISSQETQNNMTNDGKKVRKKTSAVSRPGESIPRSSENVKAASRKAGSKVAGSSSKFKKGLSQKQAKILLKEKLKGPTQKKAKKSLQDIAKKISGKKAKESSQNNANRPTQKKVQTPPQGKTKRSTKSKATQTSQKVAKKISGKNSKSSSQSKVIQPTQSRKTNRSLTKNGPAASKKGKSKNIRSRIIRRLARSLSGRLRLMSPAQKTSPRQKIQRRVRQEMTASKLPSAFAVSPVSPLGRFRRDRSHLLNRS